MIFLNYKLNLIKIALAVILNFAAYQELSANELLSPSCSDPKNSKIASLVQQEIRSEEKNDYASALMIAKKLIEIEPNNECAANTIAGVYGTIGNFDEEIIWANRAISINHSYANAYINLGNAQAAIGKTVEAELSYKKARQLLPKNPLPIYSLGVLMENSKNFEAAAELYQLSIKLDPKFENGYYNLAAMKANLKKYDEARRLLIELLKINPRATDAQDMLDSLPK